MSDSVLGSVVRAAGVVIFRRSASSTEVLIVHRPHRSDWSLPKGKVDPGEHLIETAVRECAEETGLSVALRAPLPQQSYIALGRPKTVDYWIAEIRDDEGFAPDEEIDEIRWVNVQDAGGILTYSHDRALVAEALTLPETSPLIILRHAKAMKRSDFSGSVDAQRPLTGKGRIQAKALVPLLGAYGITAVHTSDSARCADTVKAYAKSLHNKATLESSLSEEAHEENPKRAAKALRRIIESPEPAVICTHRPVMPTLMATLAESLGLSENDERLDPKLSPGAFIVVHRVFENGAMRAVAIERHDAPLSDSEDHDLLA
jgi:8-oxo-dGTP diphosphatase